MPSRASGQVLERQWRSGRGFALRVRAYGKRHYVTLGLEADGWSAERAEEELQNVLADVRRAIWIPPDRNRRPDRADTAPGDGPTATRHSTRSPPSGSPAATARSARRPTRPTRAP